MQKDFKQFHSKSIMQYLQLYHIPFVKLRKILAVQFPITTVRSSSTV